MKQRLALLAVSLLGFTSCAPATEPPTEPAPVVEEQEAQPSLEEPSADAVEEGTEASDEAIDLEIMGEGVEPGNTAPVSSSSAESAAGAPAKRVVPVTADNWLFSPALITVKKGELVELKITGAGGTHGFTVPDLGLNVPISVGETKTVTVPTDNAGTFAGFCSIPCGAGHSNMKVTIVVTE